MLRSPGFQRQAAIYVASASEDLWADPTGEGLALEAAAPAWDVIGASGRSVLGWHVRDVGMAFTATTGRAFWTGPARTWAGPDETASALNRPFADSAVRHVDDAEQVVASMGQWELDAASSSVISTAARFA